MSLVSADQLVSLKANLETLKTSIITGYGALVNMGIVLGPVLVVIMAKMGWDSSSVQAISRKLLGIATGPAGPAAIEAQNAVIQATAAVAMDKTLPKSDEAKNTLVAATIALPEVQTIVTDAKTALAAGSSSVISSAARAS
jgi:hypothetical protein